MRNTRIIALFLLCVPLAIATTDAKPPRHGLPALCSPKVVWKNDRMEPCKRTLCQGGEALYSVVAGMEMFGVGGNMAKVNRHMVKNKGYNEACDTNWHAINGLNIVKFEGESTNAGYHQVGSWLRARKVVVAKYEEERFSRAALITSADAIGSYFVLNGSGKIQKCPHANVTSFLVFK